LRVSDRECDKTATCSVSCDTSDLRQMLEGDRKATISAVGGAREYALDKNIKSYQRKNKECPFGSKLSSIREDMREFCDSMDKFTDENNIVFKNGEVEGFWGGRKMVDANLQTDSMGDDENRQIETEIRAGEKDRSRRCVEAGRITEMISEREANPRESTMETKNTERSENSDHQSSGDGKPVAMSEFQGVYDLMTLRTRPRVTLDSKTKTYPTKETQSYEHEPSAKMKEKSSIYSSLFAELKYRKKDRNTCRDRAESSNVSNELMILEKKLYSEGSTMSDTQGKSLNVTRDLDPEEKQSARYNSAETNGKYTKYIEILEDKFNDISLESPQEKRNVDESDDDSFKTATSIQEDSQVAGSNPQSPEVSKLRDNCDELAIEHKNIDNSMDIYRKETVERCNNGAISGAKDIKDEAEKSAERQSHAEENLSNSEQEFSEELDSQVRSFVQTIDHLSLERTSQPSRLTGKRTREAEDIEISNKKSFLIEELNPGRKTDERKPRSQISERCRQHLIQETRKFSKKVSPLIDKCITSLIKDTGNTGPKSQYQKYDRRSLGEYLPSDFVSRSLDKLTGERDNRGDKRDKSSDLANAQLTRGQTMKPGPIAVKKSGKIIIHKVNIKRVYTNSSVDASFRYVYTYIYADLF